MDIQLIGSVYGTASHICSYMCQGESEEVKKAIRDALNTLPAHASIHKKTIQSRQTTGRKMTFPKCTSSLGSMSNPLQGFE